MKNQFSELIAFLERLDEAKIHYTLEHSRDNAIQVTAFAPGEYWEIEFIEVAITKAQITTVLDNRF